VPCEVRKYSLTTPDKHVKVDFYAAGGMEVSVRGRADCLATWKVTSPAPEQRLENALREAAESYEIQRETVLTDYYRLGDKLKNGENIDREQMKMLKAQLDTLQAQTFSCEMGVLEQWPINEQWLEKLSSIAAYCEILPTLMDRPRAINLYNRLSDEQKASDQGQRMLWALYPENKVKEGMKSPDGNFISPDGKQHKLAEFRGKYVLVDFWFNGCMPCRLSIPELGEVSNQYKGRLEVVSLSLDAMKVWADATGEHPITWNNWNDKKGRNGLYAKFPTQGVPFYVLLSPDGTVITMQAGYAEGVIKELLKKHIAD
jgi:peroxiredoxin